MGLAIAAAFEQGTYKDAEAAGLGALASGQLTMQQAADLWDVYDRDKNGTLDRIEARNFVRDLASLLLDKYNKVLRADLDWATDEETIESFMSHLDLNGDEKVSKAEFMARAFEAGSIPCPGLKSLGVEVAISQLSREGELDKKEIERIWAKYDPNGQGYIESSGVKELMTDLVETQLAGLRLRIEEIQNLKKDLKPVVDHLYSALDLNCDGDLKRCEFIAKLLEGYELPLQDLAQKRKIGWAQKQNFSINAEELEVAKSNNVHILSKSTIDSKSKAIEAIQRGIVCVDEGFCIVFSAREGEHFVLFRDDKKRDALEACGSLKKEKEETWSLRNTFLLCKDPEVPTLDGKAELLEDVESVRMAIDGLNMGLLKCDGICCVVHSKSKEEYYVLHEAGYRDEAARLFGLPAN